MATVLLVPAGIDASITENGRHDMAPWPPSCPWATSTGPLNTFTVPDTL